MGKTRLELHQELLKITDEVWFQPPSDVSMSYPSIVYTRDSLLPFYADNKKHEKFNRYTLSVITEDPDEPIVDQILELPYTNLETSFVSENLYNYQITLYY